MSVSTPAPKSGVLSGMFIITVTLIPGSNQIRNLPDPVDLYPLLVQTGQQLQAQGYPDDYRVLNDQLPVAPDGTDTFSSEKIQFH